MAKTYSSEELASRTFWLSVAGIRLFIASIFVFVL